MCVCVYASLSLSLRRLPVFDTLWPQNKNLIRLCSGLLYITPCLFWILSRCYRLLFIFIFLFTAVRTGRRSSSAFVCFHMRTFSLGDQKQLGSARPSNQTAWTARFEKNDGRKRGRGRRRRGRVGETSSAKTSGPAKPQMWLSELAASFSKDGS